MTAIFATAQRQRQMAAMTRYAADLVEAYPEATPSAISAKLLTVFEDTDIADRWTVACSVICLVRVAA